MNLRSILVITLLLSAQRALSKSLFSGQASHRFYQALESPDQMFEFDNWVRIEQKVILSEQTLFYAQFYGYAGDRKGSLYQDFDNTSFRKQATEIWPGDLYYQYTRQGHFFRLGFQTYLWQEGIGLSYTNFINGRDFQSSVLDPVERFNRSSPSANWIYTQDAFSIQGVYLPYSQKDLILPISRTPLRAQLPSGITSVKIDEPDDQVADHEWGARFTWSGEGKDISFFTFELKDRSLIYSLSPTSSFTDLVFAGQQRRKKVSGLSTSWEIFDSIFRFEALQWKDRDFNFLNSGILDQFKSDDTALTLAWDSPAVGAFQYSIQHSFSTLENRQQNAFREKAEAFSFAALQFDLKKEKKIQAQVLYQHHDETLLTRTSYFWPISKSVEGEIAFEGSMGPQNSLGDLQRKFNHIFFQISHIF